MKKIILVFFIAASSVFTGGALIAYGQTASSADLEALDAFMREQPEYEQFYATGGTSMELFQGLINENPEVAAGLLAQYNLADTYVAPEKQAEAELSADVMQVVLEHPEISLYDSTWDTTEVDSEVFTAITTEVQQEFKATIQENPALRTEITQITTEVMPAFQQEVATAENITEILNKIEESGGLVEITIVDPATNQQVVVPVTNAENFNQFFLTSIQGAQETPQEVIEAFTGAVNDETEQNDIFIASKTQEFLDAYSVEAVNDAAQAFKQELVESAAVPVSFGQQETVPALDSIQKVAEAATDTVAETAMRAFISGNFQETARGVSTIQNMQENFFNPEKAVAMNEELKALQGADAATMQREMANFAQKYGGVEIKSEQFNRQNLQTFQQSIQNAVQSNYSAHDVKKMAEEHQNAFIEYERKALQGRPSEQQVFGFDRTVGGQGMGFGVGRQEGFTPPPFGQSAPSTGFSGSFTPPKTVEQAQQQYGQTFTPEQKSAFEQYQSGGMINGGTPTAPSAGGFMVPTSGNTGVSFPTDGMFTPPPTGTSYPSFQPYTGETSGYVAPSFTPTGTYIPPTMDGYYMAPMSGYIDPSTYVAPSTYTEPSTYIAPSTYTAPPPSGSVYDSYLGGVKNTLGGSVKQKQKPVLRKIRKTLPRPKLRQTPRQQVPVKDNSASIINNY